MKVCKIFGGMTSVRAIGALVAKVSIKHEIIHAKSIFNNVNICVYRRLNKSCNYKDRALLNNKFQGELQKVQGMRIFIRRHIELNWLDRVRLCQFLYEHDHIFKKNQGLNTH